MEFYSRPAAQLVSQNPVVPHGEFWGEEDTGRVKRGFGTTRWNDLAYYNTDGGAADAAFDTRLDTLETYPVVVRLMTADQSNSTLVLADVTELTFPVVAGGSYIFEFYLMSHSAAATTGLQVAVNGPASPTYLRCTEIAALSLSAAFFVGVDTYDEFFGNTSNSATAGSPIPLLLSGCLVNGVNAGTFALRFRSEIDTSAVTIQRGSWGRLTRVP